LVVEDDRELLQQEADLLRRHGYEVMTAENGREALDLLRRSPLPSVLILDLGLPVMDGWEVLDERNRDPALRSLPAIVVSGRTDVAERVATARAHFARKPLKPETLLKLVEELDPADEVEP
jgi:CheY-like chemotaxis protein